MLAVCGLLLACAAVSWAQASGSATVSWEAPVNSPVPIAGYRVQWGAAPGQYTQGYDVGLVTTDTLVLGVGTWYVIVRSLSANGRESLPSNEVQIVLLAPPPALPSPPGNLRVITSTVTETVVR